MSDALVNETVQGVELRASIHELHRYLGDEVAPMMVTDSVLVLMEHPPALIAPQIHAWIDTQFALGHPKYSASDFIYHALKKLHLLCEFDLIDAKRLREWLEELAGTLLAYCPEEERDKLAQQLGRLGQSEAVLSGTPVEKIYQAGGGRSAATPGPAAAPGPAASEGSGPESDAAVSRGLRRFSLLLERLGSGQEVRLAGQTDPEKEQVKMQALVTAAVQARNEPELQDYLRRLGGAGLDSRPDQVFRLLGRSLPAWGIPLGPASGSDPLPNRPMEAMRKMVDLAETPEEWARRFNDLVQVAIEQFNEGSLARAATMLDLAERMLAGKERFKDVVNAIRRRAHEAIKEDQLRKYADKPEERRMLLRFMNFFSAMTPEGLLRQLLDEKKRERRWLLLLLLEAHGPNARSAALQEIEAFLRGDRTESHGYHQRNLIYLLRRIPAGEGGPGDRELEALGRLSKLDQPPILAREAIRTLGPIDHPAAERALVTRLKEIEAAALRQAPSSGDKPGPFVELLDATCAALALQHSSTALSNIVQHSLREEPALGDTAARLDPLSAQDLSTWPEIAGRLIQALKDRLPKKIFGLVIKKREDLLHLIKALAGTPLESVKSALEEIVSKYPSQDIGIEAAKSLAALKSVSQRVEQPPAGLSGDIDLFGLPNLFQNLSESRVSGTLTLQDDRRRTCGTVSFVEGKIRGCEYFHLKGEDALYQLFERPEARKFAFRAQPAAPKDAATDEMIDVVGMLLEAMRRHDELQQARALVADGAHLKMTGAKPKRLEEEEDLKLTQLVWSKAASGSTAVECESETPADAYRVRRLLVHWVESGALQLGVASAVPVSAPAGRGAVSV